MMALIFLALNYLFGWSDKFEPCPLNQILVVSDQNSGWSCMFSGNSTFWPTSITMENPSQHVDHLHRRTSSFPARQRPFKGYAEAIRRCMRCCRWTRGDSSRWTDSFDGATEFWGDEPPILMRWVLGWFGRLNAFHFTCQRNQDCNGFFLSWIYVRAPVSRGKGRPFGMENAEFPLSCWMMRG